MVVQVGERCLAIVRSHFIWVRLNVKRSYSKFGLPVVLRATSLSCMTVTLCNRTKTA